MTTKFDWFASSPEKMVLNEDDARELYTKLKKYVNTKKLQLVGVTAHGVGAGHYKQILVLKRDLEKKIGVSIPIINISMTDDLFAASYAKLQKHSKLYDYFSRIYVKLPGFLIDRLLAHKSKKIIAWNDLIKLGLDPKVETIFLSTYVIGSIGVTGLIKNGWKGKLVEYVPDPWLGNQLRSMTTAFPAQDHIVVVHNEETATELIKMRKFQKDQVLAWGTLSPDHKIKVGDKESQSKSVLIEFSGNESLKYTQKINDFVTSIENKIKKKKVKLTIHTMHHTKTRSMVIGNLKRLGLFEKVVVVFGEDLSRAVESRLDIIAGLVGNSPDIRLGKGEVPVEHFDGILVGIWGAGHEKRNAQVGEMTGRGLNLIDVPVEQWWQKIEEFSKNKDRKKPPQSWAKLALLWFMREK